MRFITAGNAFRELKNVKLFPSVGMKKNPGAHVKANFGQYPFIFDIDAMMAVSLLFPSCSLLPMQGFCRTSLCANLFSSDL